MSGDQQTCELLFTTGDSGDLRCAASDWLARETRGKTRLLELIKKRFRIDGIEVTRAMGRGTAD